MASTPMDRMTTGEGAVDVARLLDEGKWTGFQKLVLLLAALAFAVDGFANQVLGLAIPEMVKDWSVAREAFAPVIAIGLGGLAVGTILGGMAGDRFGRRPTLITAVILFGGATALISMAGNIETLAALRLIDGLGLGAAVPNATSLIAEYTPARKRSLAISLGMIFIPFGSILSGVAASKILPVAGWPELFLAAGGCSLTVAVILFLTLPESPRFLLRDERRHGQLRKLMGRFGHRLDGDAALLQDESGRRLTVPIHLLFGPDIRRDTVALWAAFFCCLLSTYTMQSWGPSVFASAGVGMGLVGGIMAGFGMGGIIGSVVAGALIEKIGSRVTIFFFAVSAIIVAVAMAFVPLASVSTPVIVAGAALLGAALSGIQSPLYALSAHVYAPACRATGVGMASAMGRVGAMVSSFTGVLTLNAAGSQGFFLFLGLVVLLCIFGMSAIGRHIPRS